MADLTPAQQKTRIILIAAALLLPSLSLLPLGGLYLYQNGWLLYWALAALAVAMSGFLVERAWMSSGERRLAKLEAADERLRREGHLTLSDRAWGDVRAIASKVDPETLTSAEDVLKLGQRTIDAVARRMHPEREDAIWQFTLPEALVIAERVSARLGTFVETQIPLGDRLTVAQLLSVYRWRGMVGVAERAYDVWRIIRFANPATAMTHEAREQLSRAVVNWSKERVGRRIAEAYVQEVGRAAIDLYGGRLRPHGETRAAAEIAKAEEIRKSRALRAVVTGSSPARVDTMSAVAAIADEQTEREEKSRILFSLNEAIGVDAVGRRQLLRDAGKSDVILWCIDRVLGVTAGDLAAAEALKGAIAGGKIEQAPGVIIVSLQSGGQSPQDAETQVESLSAMLERFGRMPVVTLLLSESGPQRDIDALAIADAIRDQVARAPSFAAAQHRSGGLTSAAKQAVTAAGTLAGQLFSRRN
ncbi:MAG TPA: hypothetical protein VFX71_03395 [Hyphomicrobium sp.]|nr:hypothetical protein [Hyphomicrobium sp.]